jgi:NhaA family Na+:H+ antiporter
VLLLAATIAALLWANLGNGSYDDFWRRAAGIDGGALHLRLDLRHWVNDALMTLFFFVVALEIRRELTRGELRGRSAAALPVAAALGGMVMPVAIYILINAGQPSMRGWGMPMATDIAFALGVLSLLSKRVPLSLRAFLLALAIVDDIGGMAVIGLFYTADLSVPWLGMGVAVIATAYCLAATRLHHWLPYAVLGCIAWYAVHESGVHATIAGVGLALVVPQNPTKGRAIYRAEDLLHPWSSFLVVPMFALANAGVVLSGSTLARTASSNIALGTMVALIIGKPLGVVFFASLAVRSGIASLPRDVTWSDLLGVGLVSGIGFTVAIFIATLAFKDPPMIEEAKIGIFIASLTSAILGSSWLFLRQGGGR